MSIISYLPLLMQGIAVTAAAWCSAACVSLVLGITLGIVSCRALGLTKIATCIRCYTFISRGIPAYVQILIAYFVLPALLHISIPAFVAATGALALCSAGYVTEIVRAGMNNIPRGQWEACFVLGYSRKQAIVSIIAPQALHAVLPALIGELEQLLKSSSLLATIGVTEITRAGMNIISRELNPIPVYLTIACIYLMFSALLNLLGTFIERKAARGYRY